MGNTAREIQDNKRAGTSFPVVLDSRGVGNVGQGHMNQ